MISAMCGSKTSNTGPYFSCAPVVRKVSAWALSPASKAAFSPSQILWNGASSGSAGGVVTKLYAAALALPAASVTTMDHTSPAWAAIWAVKLPSALAVTVTFSPVRVLVIVTRAPPSTLPAAPVTVTWPLVTPLTVISPRLGAGGGSVSTGGGGTVTVTSAVFGSLSTVPSLTINCPTYVPAASGTKDGRTVVSPAKVAVLLGGKVVRAH